MNTETILCAFCSAPFTKEMMEVYEGSYGCDTGCSTVVVEVTCANCKRVCYEKSELGGVYKETSEEEWKEIIETARAKGMVENIRFHSETLPLPSSREG